MAFDSVETLDPWVGFWFSLSWSGHVVLGPPIDSLVR